VSSAKYLTMLRLRLSAFVYPVFLALLIAAGVRPLHARISIYPDVLYSGMNVITIKATDGLSRVEWSERGRWRMMKSGITTPIYRIVAGPIFSSCATSATFTVYVNYVSVPFRLRFRATDCDDDNEVFDLSLSTTWNLYREDFGEVEAGKQACHKFTVFTQEGSFRVDSITSPSPLFTIRYTGPRPPIRVRGTYTYQVCITPTRPGFISRPIFVYIRRDQPAGGYTNFVVADTAYVTVVPSRSAPAPRPAAIPKPRPAPPVRPPLGERVRPPSIIIEPAPKPKPVRIPDIDTVGIREAPPVVPQVERDSVGTKPPFAEPPPDPEFVTDPTTFRVLLTPTAKSIGEGNVFLANYDVAGWVFGYGASERLSLLGGFLFVPGIIDYNLVASAGAKYEFLHDGFFRAAAGGQFSFSQTERSSITVTSPYAVASLGDDDQRANLLLGYSWRHHTPVVGESFDRRAGLVGVGGDYRIGFNWKLVGELVLIENSDVQPLTLTARYFSSAFSVDAGVLVNVSPTGSGLRVGPVLNGVWVW
jgi:hypothetical protein